MEKTKRPSIKEIFGDKEEKSPESEAVLEEAIMETATPIILKKAARRAPRKRVKKAAEKTIESASKIITESKPEIVDEKMATPVDLPAAEPIIQAVPEITAEETPKKSKLKKVLLAVLVAVIIIGAGATGYYFYYKYKNAPAAAVNETEDIATRAGKLMELPNETATLATVMDKEKLKGRPFFAKAENGDKALIYTQAKKAILYRPSTNKIIEVMYLAINQNATPVLEPVNPEQAQTPAQAPVVTESVKITIYNGTTQKGLAKSLATKIAAMAEAKVVKTGNAIGNFEKTIVVDLSGNNQKLAQKIAEAVGGEVGSLPDGEVKPEADILVIAGSDFVK